MKIHYSTFVLAIAIPALCCLAQDMGDAANSVDPVEVDRMVASEINERLNFARTMYELNPDQVKQLTEWLTQVAPAEKDYLMHSWKTLMSQRAALGAAKTPQPPDQVNDPVVVARVVDKIKRQIVNLQASAPMSYANTLRRLEGTLLPDQAVKGREHIKVKFQDRLKPGQIKVELPDVDELANPPTAMDAPMELGRSAASDPGVVPPVPPTPASPPGVNPHPPIPMAPPTPVIRDYAPAPAVDQWKGELDKIISKFGFEGDQKTRAETIGKGYVDDATKYRDEHKADFAAAGNESDAGKKVDRMKELNKPLDRMYYEMTGRVDSLASIEQRQKAEKATAATTTPTAPTPAPTAPTAPTTDKKPGS